MWVWKLRSVKLNIKGTFEKYHADLKLLLPIFENCIYWWVVFDILLIFRDKEKTFCDIDTISNVSHQYLTSKWIVEIILVKVYVRTIIDIEEFEYEILRLYFVQILISWIVLKSCDLLFFIWFIRLFDSGSYIIVYFIKIRIIEINQVI